MIARQVRSLTCTAKPLASIDLNLKIHLPTPLGVLCTPPCLPLFSLDLSKHHDDDSRPRPNHTGEQPSPLAVGKVAITLLISWPSW